MPFTLQRLRLAGLTMVHRAYAGITPTTTPATSSILTATTSSPSVTSPSSALASGSAPLGHCSGMTSERWPSIGGAGMSVGWFGSL
jgi:hypothetical protein